MHGNESHGVFRFPCGGNGPGHQRLLPSLGNWESGCTWSYVLVSHLFARTGRENQVPPSIFLTPPCCFYNHPFPPNQILHCQLPIILFSNWAPWELAMPALLFYSFTLQALPTCRLCREGGQTHTVLGAKYRQVFKEEGRRLALMTCVASRQPTLLSIRWFQFFAFNQSEGVQIIKESNYSENFFP